jgi:hypothetical protein
LLLDLFCFFLFSSDLNSLFIHATTPFYCFYPFSYLGFVSLRLDAYVCFHLASNFSSKFFITKVELTFKLKYLINLSHYLLLCYFALIFYISCSVKTTSKGILLVTSSK